MDLKEQIQSLISKMGFPEAQVTVDDEHHKVSIVIDDENVRAQLPTILPALEHLINLILRKTKLPAYVVDLNYYRRERERLIVELAKAAAKKAAMTKGEVALPPMNAYERRLVHVEISTNPDLKTESVGAGRDRHIIIQPTNL
jgi:spoIIIJ-associated protein